MTSASTRSATARCAERVEHDRLPSRPDTFCDLAESELPKRGQAIGAEEVVERDARTLRGVDLAGAQPLLQRLRRQVDEHDLVGLLEHLVGECLPDAHVGELGDRVVQAFEMLDVDG